MLEAKAAYESLSLLSLLLSRCVEHLLSLVLLDLLLVILILEQISIARSLDFDLTRQLLLVKVPNYYKTK